LEIEKDFTIYGDEAKVWRVAKPFVMVWHTGHGNQKQSEKDLVITSVSDH